MINQTKSIAQQNRKLTSLVFIVIAIFTSSVTASAQDNQLKLATTNKLTKVSQFDLKYYTQVIKSGVFSYVTNHANVQQASNTPLIDNSSSQKKFVEFMQPVDQNTLSSFVKTSQIIPEEIIFTQGEIRGGYTLKSGESVDSAIKNLKDKHTKFLDYAITNTLTEINNTKSTFDLNRLNNLKTVFSKAKIETINGNIKITAFIDNKADVKISISPNPLIKSVTDYNIIPQEVINPRAAKVASTHYVNPALWYPTKGSTKTNKSMAFNTFYFNDASGFDAFDGILTYEHETQVYDANFADYDDYWSSNLPNAYKDTQKSDSSVIDNFTVGSSKASDIIENKQYYTSMDLKGGSASNAIVRIKGQLGHRIPSFCDSALFCIFPDMTTPTLKMYTAPISTQIPWTYNP